jgi:hypothetical protein
MYRRVDDHAAQLDLHQPDATAKTRKPHHRFRKAA